MDTLRKMIMTQFKSNDPEDYARIKAYIEDFMFRTLRPEEYDITVMFNKLKGEPARWDDDTWIPEGGGMRPHPWDNNTWDK